LHVFVLLFGCVYFSSIPFQVYGGLPCSSSSSTATLSAYAQILFSGIGQIYLVGDPISGAIMLAGVVFSSRVCATCMCAGVIVGSLVGAFIGASICDLASGLYGYDSSLSFIAVYYALCSNSDRKLLHSIAAAVAATLMHTAVSVTMAKVALPSGTLGFVFATMVVVCCVKGTEKDVRRMPPDDLVLEVAPSHVLTDTQPWPFMLPMPNLILEQQHQERARDTRSTMLQLV
jgi:urea transporter